ncbi:MAG: MBL fold metallo-hydrolase [Candidatus Saccharimonadales bacterium]
MEIQYHGANCVTITTKHSRVVIDDNLADLGGKSVSKKDDILLFSGSHSSHPEARLLVDQPGEYEISGISIYGIPARSHLENETNRSATIYKLVVEDVRILAVGHIYSDLTDKQLEMIGMVDIMLVPVGGNGFTLDPVGALKLIKKIEPKVVVPTYYANPSLNYPVPQQSLEEALKTLSMEVKETTARFKPKPESLSDGITKLVILEG